MNDQQLRRFSVTLTQFLLGLIVLAVIVIALGVNQNQAALDAVKASEATVEIQLFAEMTVAAELTATLQYVTSPSQVEDYNRGEARRVLPGEVRVVPMETLLPPEPTATPLPTPDPILNAEEWMMWWYLLTDRQPPQRPVVATALPDS
jgi:hypothetical protein